MSDDPVPRAVHRHRRRGVRLPRLPRRDPPAGARPARRRPVPRPRLHRAGHHHDAVRHDRAQPGVPLPPRDGRDQQRQADPARRRPSSRPGARRSSPSTRRTSSSTSRTCPRSATGPSATGPSKAERSLISPTRPVASPRPPPRPRRVLAGTTGYRSPHRVGGPLVSWHRRQVREALRRAELVVQVHPRPPLVPRTRTATSEQFCAPANLATWSAPAWLYCPGVADTFFGPAAGAAGSDHLACRVRPLPGVRPG